MGTGDHRGHREETTEKCCFSSAISVISCSNFCLLLNSDIDVRKRPAILSTVATIRT
jgi:hypothetical protein